VVTELIQEKSDVQSVGTVCRCFFFIFYIYLFNGRPQRSLEILDRSLPNFQGKVSKVCKVHFSNSRVPFAHFCTCKKKIAKLAYLANYLRTCSTDLERIFSFDKDVSGDDLSDVRFEIAQMTLLWQLINWGGGKQ